MFFFTPQKHLVTHEFWFWSIQGWWNLPRWWESKNPQFYGPVYVLVHSWIVHSFGLIRSCNPKQSSLNGCLVKHSFFHGKDWESSNWNNQFSSGCLGFQDVMLPLGSFSPWKRPGSPSRGTSHRDWPDFFFPWGIAFWLRAWAFEKIPRLGSLGIV